ncbi:Endoribonuclease Dicer, partial [Cichlidogyrus casuarinus]
MDDNVNSYKESLARSTFLSVSICYSASNYRDSQEEVIIVPLSIAAQCNFVRPNIHMIVLDECHEILSSEAQFHQIYHSEWFQSLVSTQPRVLGFTSSLLANCHLEDFSVFLNRLQTLEDKLKAKLETSSELINMLAMGAKPKEEIIKFQQPTQDSPLKVEAFVRTILEETKTTLQLTNSDEKNDSKMYDPKGRVIFIIKYCLSAIDEVESCLNSLGLWSAALVAKVFVRHLISLNKQRQTLLSKSENSTTEHPEDSLSRLVRFTTTQFLLVNRGKLHFVPTNGLLELPNKKYIYRAVIPDKEEAERNERLCGMILVDCQFTAYALSKLLEELCVWDEELFFLKMGHLFFTANAWKSKLEESSKPAFQVSTNTIANSVRTGDEITDDGDVDNGTCLPASQEETVANFRRGNINLLVATQCAVSAISSTVELPRCNLVIKFKTPDSFSDYLTSKARSHIVKSDAKICFLQASQNVQLHQILDRFRQFESILVQKSRLSDLFAEEHSHVAQQIDALLPPMQLGEARLLMSRAINLINQYCARLPSDFLTSLHPRWRLVKVPLDGEAPDRITCGNGKYNWICYLRLPINCPLSDEVAGLPMPCIKLAKISASAKMLQALLQSQEVNSQFEYCNKESRYVDCYLKEVKKKTSFQPAASRRQHYDKEISLFRHHRPQLGNRNYLYFLHMRLMKP